MDLENTVKQSWRQEAIIKSLVWNAVVEVFKEKKEIDISQYLWSIQLKQKKIYIKTTKSIIKTEMMLYDDTIQKKIEEKFKKIWIRSDKVEIIYI